MPLNIETLGEFNVAYFKLRVSHLEQDEVDFELNSRGVVVLPESDQSDFQRRCQLRGFLVKEQKSLDTARSFQGDVGAEFGVCRGKFESMKKDLGCECPNREVFRSRLLHLGARLQIVKNYAVGEALRAFENLLSDVVTLHGYHFAKGEVLSLTANEGEKDGDVDLLDQIATGALTGGNSQLLTERVPTNQVVQENVFDVLLDIRAEIKKTQQQIRLSETRTTSRVDTLEAAVKILTSGLASIKTIASELQKTKREVETLRETVSELQAIVDKVIPDENSPSLPVETDDLRSRTSPDLSDLPEIQQTSEGLFIPKDLQKNLGIPKQPLQKLFDSAKVDSSRIFEKSKPAFHSQQPSFANFSLPRQPESTGSVEITGYHRRPQRVADWKIKKYAGNDEGLGLNEFLESVNLYAESEQISEIELFNSAMHLFTGNALAWYQAMRSQKRFYNWNHLVCELKANFVHPELDAVLKMQASQRRQQRNESFQDFYLAMEKIFRAMTVPLSPSEKLDLLKRNMRFDYKQVLILRPVNTLSELMLLGKNMDASRTPIFQKVFGNFKEVSAISEKPAVNGYNQSQQQQQPSAQGNGYRPRVFYNKNSPPGSPQHKRPPSFRFRDTGGQRNLHERPTTSPKPTQSQDGVICLNSLVDKHRPPNLGVCYNCGIQGHEHDKCSKPKRIFCVLCGFKGFEASHCPYCLKHGIRSN